MTPTSSDSSSTRGRDRKRNRGPRSSAVPTYATTAILGILLDGAPMACGAVHRLTFLITLGLCALLSLAAAWLATRCRSKVATAVALAFPLFFLVTAAAQIIPVPSGLRTLLDPKGSALLSLAGLQGAHIRRVDPVEIDQPMRAADDIQRRAKPRHRRPCADRHRGCSGHSCFRPQTATR